MRKRLLPRDVLIKTSDLDQGDWTYRDGPLGWVSRTRFQMVLRRLRQLNDDPQRVILELGYGSGLFLPALADYGTVVGVDVHEFPVEVQSVLADNGVEANLLQGRAEELPLADSSVDVVVAVSMLEFLDDVDAAASEIARVLRPGGRCIAVTPGHSPWIDWVFTRLTGHDPEETFQGRRGTGLPALRRHLRQVGLDAFPPVIPESVFRHYSCGVFRRI